MTSPCPKCGETRTDSVPHGTLYNLVWAFGYRLRCCSRCRAKRFVPRHDGKYAKKQQGGKQLTAEARPNAKGVQATEPFSSDVKALRCPACGKAKYHRTRRTQLERLRRAAPMARCDNCGNRFPYPADQSRRSDSARVRPSAASASSLAEEGRAAGVPDGPSLPQAPGEGTDSSKWVAGCCPACGSASYRRSHRTALERLLSRPRMARCQQCRTRFPYPET